MQDNQIMYFKDENGNELPLAMIDAFDFNDDHYALFVTPEENLGEDEEPAMYIMKPVIQDGEIADFMKLGGNNDDEKVALLIRHLRGMNDDLNIPHCIKHYGADSYPTENGFVPEEVFLARLPEIAKNAIGDACTGSNPRIPTQEEMEKLLKCCYYDTEVDF